MSEPCLATYPQLILTHPCPHPLAILSALSFNKPSNIFSAFAALLNAQLNWYITAPTPSLRTVFMPAGRIIVVHAAGRCL